MNVKCNTSPHGTPPKSVGVGKAYVFSIYKGEYFNWAIFSIYCAIITLSLLYYIGIIKQWSLFSIYRKTNMAITGQLRL